jgi:hypothetical protein
MKTLFLALIMITTVLFSIPAMGDERTLLSGKVDHGGFGGPDWKMTKIYGDMGLMAGGKGAWIIDHKVFIGGGGYGLVNDISAPVADRFLNLGYGGVVVGGIIGSDKVVHLCISALIGGGGVNYRKHWEDMNGRCDYDDDDDIFCNDDSKPDFISNDNFFVIEPGVDLELNVAKFMRITFGVSYRIVNGLQGKDLKNSDLSGVSANVMLKFGKF